MSGLPPCAGVLPLLMTAPKKGREGPGPHPPKGGPTLPAVSSLSSQAILDWKVGVGVAGSTLEPGALGTRCVALGK